MLLVAGMSVKAQENETILQYIAEYRDLAISEMQRTGVPASIKLAQGIHETTAGTSALVRKSNNHFGIKCKSNWTGPSVSHDDDARGECFRKYDRSADSWKDHSDFLKGSPRYASLFDLDPMDYKDWAYGLKKAGYATNPRYPQIIVKLIEDYHLQDYTLIALGKMKTGEETIAQLPAKIKDAISPVQTTEKTTVQETIEEPVAVAAEERPSYPSGEFRINDTRVIYASGGTSMLSVAQRYNIALAKLFEFNDMEPVEVLANDQLIYLQRKRKTCNTEFHIVKPGETLHDIARIEAIRLESLMEYNYLGNNSRLSAGTKLYLNKKAPAGTRRVAINE